MLCTLKKDQAAAKGNNVSDEELKKIEENIVAQYEKEGSPYYSTSRLWDDGVIDPAHTRDVLGMVLEISLNAPFKKVKYGIFRM